MKKAALSELCSIAGGIPAPKQTTPSGDVPFVRMRELGDAHLTTNFVPSNEFLNKHDEKLFAAKIVQPGATLFPRSGSVHLNHRALLRVPAVIVSHIAALIPNEQTDPEFLYHLLTSYDMTEIMTQTTGLNMIKFGQLKDVIFAVPETKPEQSKIAEILSVVDRAIEQTEALIAKQQRIKTGLMQDLLTKGIDEHGNIRSEATHAFKDSPLGRIPVEWDVNLLDVLAERGSGHTPSKRRPEYWNGGIKWISLADSSVLDRVHINTTLKEISDLGLKNSSAVMHPAGTVVLSRDAGVGKSAVMECNMAVSQHFMAWRCGKRLHNYYLYYWLQRDKPKFEGIASGSTIVTIGLQFFKSYQIAHPLDTAEQIKIAKVLLESDKHLFRLEDVWRKLGHMRSGLMHDLLTGERRVIPLLA